MKNTFLTSKFIFLPSEGLGEPIENILQEIE